MSSSALLPLPSSDMAAPRLVVVDGLHETAAVLRAVFEPRGHHVERVRGYEWATHEDAAARIVVLHEESGVSNAGQDRRVVIRSGSPGETAAHTLAAPFEYPDLIAAIETLIDSPSASRRRAA